MSFHNEICVMFEKKKKDISYIKPNLYRPKYASKIYLNDNCYKE